MIGHAAVVDTPLPTGTPPTGTVAPCKGLPVV